MRQSLGGLAFLGGLGRHRRREHVDKTNLMFQTFSTDISTSWEDRCRTYLGGLRGNSISDTEWVSFLNRHRDDIRIFANQHIVFTSEALGKCRQLLEELRGGQLTDADFEMIMKDFYNSKSIPFNNEDLRHIRLVRAGGNVNTNLSTHTHIIIQVPPTQVTNTHIIEEYHYKAPEKAQVALHVEEEENTTAASDVETQETSTTTTTATQTHEAQSESSSSSSASFSSESAS